MCEMVQYFRDTVTAVQYTVNGGNTVRSADTPTNTT